MLGNKGFVLIDNYYNTPTLLLDYLMLIHVK